MQMNTITPKHIAIIMDGNGRWAKRKHLPRMAGHKAGAEAVRRIIKSCIEKKIEVLTLFAFSSENWQRPASEVSYLTQLLSTLLRRETKKMHENNIQLHIIGDRSRFGKTICTQMNKAEQLTQKNTGLKLVIAANYGGRWDISETIRKIAIDIESGRLASKDVTLTLVQKHIALADFPEPDLLIRTSGEQRISNFLLWQLAYTELYFTDVFWPDFTEIDLDKALHFFANRERRFGK